MKIAWRAAHARALASGAALACLLTACASGGEPPTAPTDSPTPIYPVVQTQGKGEIQTTLYYRFLDEPYLIAHTRKVTLAEGETPEAAVIRTLLEGAPGDQPDARPLTEGGVRLADINANEGYLEVTLSKEFLMTPRSAPSDWSRTPSWAETIYTSRRLAVQAIVNSALELRNYDAVQIFVESDSAQRLLLSEVGMLDEGQPDQPLEPLKRQSEAALTPIRTVEVALDCVTKKDMARLDHFIEGNAGDPRHPQASELTQRLVEPATLNAFELDGASLMIGGQGLMASIDVTYTFTDESGATRDSKKTTLWLRREREVWKMEWASLRALYAP